MCLVAGFNRRESAFRAQNLGVCLRFLTVLCCGLLVHQETASAEIVASYSFDDGASDGSGNGHDGELHGAPQAVAGIEGSALHFDGLADAISIPHSGSFPSDSFTLSAWVRVSATPRVDSIILQKYSDGVGYRLRIDGESGAVVLEAGEVSVQAPFPLFANVWTFVTGTYDGSDLVLGVDGTTTAAASVVGLTIGNTADVWIAADGGAADHFLGDVDEVAIDDTSWADSVVCANAKLVWDSANNLCAVPFVDVAFDLGVDDSGRFGFGACLVDIDQDGWLDLYFVNGSGNPMPPQPDGECVDPDDLPDEFPFVNINSLYMNNGDGTFTENVAAEFGLDDGWNAMRNVFGDYDNDGLRDMFSHNFLRSTLYRAVSGPDPMVYEDWNDETGLHICLRDGTGASWVDLNFDGWLDLYTVEYNSHVPPEEGISYLHINNGDGTFTEVTAEAGIDLPQNAMGVAFADYDNDGDQDVFVTNSYPTTSRLYRNEGVNENGVPQFVDVAEEAGVALGAQGALGVGVGWGDYNNDGYLDLLFSRTFDSRLFRNDGPDGSGIWRFTDVTGDGGPGEFNSSGHNFWGGNFADLDNDGWLDVMLMNRSLSSSPNLLFMNNRDGTWREVAEFHGMDFPDLPQLGFVPGDIDNDGDLDVVLVTHTTEPNALFRNDGRGNNWIQFRLAGTLGMSNLDAVGSRITLTATPQPGEPGFQQIREVRAGSGFFSDLPRIQTFGLGKAAIVDQVHIDWPNGEQLDLVNVPINQRLDLVEGEPPPAPIVTTLSIAGPAVVTDTGTHSFVAEAEYYYAEPGEATADAAWSVEPGDYAEFTAPGELTVSAVPTNQTVVITASVSGVESSMSLLIQPGNIVDTNPPTLTVAQGGNITTDQTTVVLNGTAEDDLGVVVAVRWSSDQGAGGPCTGLAEWSTGPIDLVVGANVITVRAADNADNESSTLIMVERVEPEPVDQPPDPDPIDEVPDAPEPPADEPSEDDTPEPGDPSDPPPINDGGQDAQATNPTGICGALGMTQILLLSAALWAFRRRA